MSLLPVLVLALLLAAPSAMGVPRKASLPSATPTRPSYIDCQNSSECEPGNCCVLGGDRYSIPTCRPYHELGAVCRPGGHKPFNTTVGYPDHSQVDLSVFWLFCPCAEGLSCRREDNSCQKDK